MFEGSRGKDLSRSTKCARGLAVCAFAVLAAISWDANAQGIPIGWNAPDTVDSTDISVIASPSIVTDGAGNWVQIWSSDTDIGGTGADTEILVATSSDNGVTWSAPTTLNTNAAVDAADDNTPNLATDGTTWVAVWEASGNILFSTSNDAGATWSAPVAQSSGGTVPDVAVDSSSGVWVTVSADGGNIASENSLSGAGGIVDGAADNPSVATDNGGTFVTAYESGLNLGVANSTDNGATWSAPQSLDSGGTDAGPFVGYDPQVDTFIVLWSSDTAIFMAASSDGGATWSAASTIITGADPGSAVSAATDANGVWVLVFSQLNGDADIVFSLSPDNGVTWGPTAFVADTTTTDENPSIATDGAGQWLSIWEALDLAAITDGNSILLATGITTTTVGLGGGGDDGPCFIASAAYGTPMAKDIEVLRQMRDTYMMNNALGLFFVDAYYTVSPVIADQVAQYPWAASLVRALLIPLLFVVELFMRAPVPFLLMGIFVAAMIVRRRMTTRRLA